MFGLNVTRDTAGRYVLRNDSGEVVTAMRDRESLLAVAFGTWDREATNTYAADFMRGYLDQTED